MSYILQFFYSQLFVTPKYPTHDFSGQVVIVTGANVGLGFEAARHFARLNAAKVVLACRSTAKGETAKDSIEQSTGRKGVVEVWPLDLGSYDSVKAFAKRASDLPRLDVLLENAGIATEEWKVTEGNESTITTNVISTFLLALLALPKLRETATKFNITPKLIIVSSEVHFFTNLPEKANPSIFDELNDEKRSKMNIRYPTSKLLEVLYVRELAKALDSSSGPSVILNTLNPGLCHSNLAAANASAGEPFFIKMMKFLVGRTTEVGSRTLVAGAVAGAESHGKYMSDGVVATPSAFVRSDDGAATAKRVWTELNERLEKIEPGVTKNI